MLAELRLEQFVIIDAAEIEFGPGLNVLDRRDRDGQVDRDRCDRVPRWRAGRHRLDPRGGIRAAGRGDLRRRTPSGAAAIAARIGAVRGRSAARCAANCEQRAGEGDDPGASASRVGDLRATAEQLLAIHGQGEHRRLLDPTVQLDLIDRYARCLPLRDRYVAARARWTEAAREWTAARARLAELIDKEEWHRFQLDEIDASGIAPGEEDRLRVSREELAHRRQAMESAGRSSGFSSTTRARRSIESRLRSTGSEDPEGWRRSEGRGRGGARSPATGPTGGARRACGCG